MAIVNVDVNPTYTKTKMIAGKTNTAVTTVKYRLKKIIHISKLIPTEAF